MKPILLSLFILALTPSCQSLKDFAGSPIGQVVISAAGALIVSEAVEQHPELEPVLLALADHQEGIPIDPNAFEDPVYALAVQTVGEVTNHYGDEATSQLIAETIRTGVQLARPSK